MKFEKNTGDKKEPDRYEHPEPVISKTDGNVLIGSPAVIFDLKRYFCTKRLTVCFWLPLCCFSHKPAYNFS